MATVRTGPAAELEVRSACACVSRDGTTEDTLRRVIGLVEMLLQSSSISLPSPSNSVTIHSNTCLYVAYCQWNTSDVCCVSCCT